MPRGLNARHSNHKQKLRGFGSAKRGRKPGATMGPATAARPRFMATLRVNTLLDEFREIVGESEEPYLGLFHNSLTDSKQNRLLPEKHDPAAIEGREDAQTDTPTSVTTPVHIHYGLEWDMVSQTACKYPDMYSRAEYIAVCPFCLDFRTNDFALARHMEKCYPRFPPGREIYRGDEQCVFEVDGEKAPLFCQNLCLLGKTFLKSKDLYEDVQPFLFYVLTEIREDGHRVIGYFSKQKIYSYKDASMPALCLSCIVVLPCYGSRGCGQFLIDLSYSLIRLQGCVAEPETPLSLQGEQAFRRYWRMAVCGNVHAAIEDRRLVSIKSISQETGISINHVMIALDDLKWIKDGQWSSNSRPFELINPFEPEPNDLKLSPILWFDFYEVETALKSAKQKEITRRGVYPYTFHVRPSLLVWIAGLCP